MARSPAEILRDARTIAVVGASPSPSRSSYGIARRLQAAGYRIVPVRPRDVDEVLGERVVESLAEIPGRVDIVLAFRRPEHAPEIAREAVAIGAGALWLQTGIVSAEARRIAEEAGLDYVEDTCAGVVHSLYLEG